MRKIASIFLLIIYLYDLGGYLGIRHYLVYYTACFFEQQAARGMYNRNDLVEVKIPVNLPAIHDWPGYEAIKGHIQFGDNAYNYVAMRVTRQMLYLKCVPDYTNTRFNTSNVIHAKPIRNVPVPKKDHVPTAATPFPHSFSKGLRSIGLEAPVAAIRKNTFIYIYAAADRHIDIPKQPPEMFC